MYTHFLKATVRGENEVASLIACRGKFLNVLIVSP